MAPAACPQASFIFCLGFDQKGRMAAGARIAAARQRICRAIRDLP
jgi:hypothetical protein